MPLRLRNSSRTEPTTPDQGFFRRKVTAQVCRLGEVAEQERVSLLRLEGCDRLQLRADRARLPQCSGMFPEGRALRLRACRCP
jgi:hypothetical protein